MRCQHGTQAFVFIQPINPEDLVKSQLFRKRIAPSGYIIAAYNTKWEGELLGLDLENMIELQPAPYVPKERFIQVQTLDSRRGSELPEWNEENRALICFHNISCVIKEIFILLMLETFGRTDFRKQYEELFRTHHDKK